MFILGKAKFIKEDELEIYRIRNPVRLTSLKVGIKRDTVRVLEDGNRDTCHCSFISNTRLNIAL